MITIYIFGGFFIVKFFKWRRGLWLGLVLLIVGGVLGGCQSKSTTNSSANKKLTVVTTTDFYGEVAKAVGGQHVKVTSVINNPSVDPHDYEPTSNVAKEVAAANVVIANGLGYDGWMSKLVKNADQATYIKVGETVMGKKNGDNPHIWYNPQTMPVLAKYVAKQLSKQDPTHRKAYEANAQKYIASLKPVQQKLTALQELAKKTSNKTVFVSEPVFDYALSAMGFKVGNRAFELAVENGSDPSPKIIKKMQADIKAHKIAFFVENKQVSDKIVTNMTKLAQQNNIPVLKVTETKPAHQTYKQWMLSQYTQLHQILTDK
nr:metal ABC transporter solute-binding protein [Lactiplantibacillus fabifermentans]